MNKFVDFVKTLRLGRVLTAFLLGAVLLLTTACNNGSAVGARPNKVFKDASSFLGDTADSASDRPELKANPGIEQ
jgi:hypothetical protein